MTFTHTEHHDDILTSPAALPKLSDGHHHRHASKYPLRVCSSCNFCRLERSSRKGFLQVFLSLFSFFPYKCRTCFHREYCFVPSGYLLHTFWISLLLIWTGFVAYRSFGPQTSGGYGAILAANAGYSSSASMSTFEKMVMARKPHQVMRNEDVVRLVRGGVSSALMITLLRHADQAFDLTPEGVLVLKQAGIEESVIAAMVDRAGATEERNKSLGGPTL